MLLPQPVSSQCLIPRVSVLDVQVQMALKCIPPSCARVQSSSGGSVGGASSNNGAPPSSGGSVGAPPSSNRLPPVPKFDADVRPTDPTNMTDLNIRYSYWRAYALSLWNDCYQEKLKKVATTATITGLRGDLEKQRIDNGKLFAEWTNMKADRALLIEKHSESKTAADKHDAEMKELKKAHKTEVDGLKKELEGDSKWKRGKWSDDKNHANERWTWDSDTKWSDGNYHANARWSWGSSAKDSHFTIRGWLCVLVVLRW